MSDSLMPAEADHTTQRSVRTSLFLFFAFINNNTARDPTTTTKKVARGHRCSDSTGVHKCHVITQANDTEQAVGYIDTYIYLNRIVAIGRENGNMYCKY